MSCLCFRDFRLACTSCLLSPRDFACASICSGAHAELEIRNIFKFSVQLINAPGMYFPAHRTPPSKGIAAKSASVLGTAA
eukprot:2094291-Rhodomonas_salina.1